MYSVWFDDLEKAVAAIRKVIKSELFCKVIGNACGDFVFEIAEGETYIVRHTDFTVWHNYGDWYNSEWREVK